MEQFNSTLAMMKILCLQDVQICHQDRPLSRRKAIIIQWCTDVQRSEIAKRVQGMVRTTSSLLSFLGKLRWTLLEPIIRDVIRKFRKSKHKLNLECYLNGSAAWYIAILVPPYYRRLHY
jgi:hypothetical protein